MFARRRMCLNRERGMAHPFSFDGVSTSKRGALARSGSAQIPSSFRALRTSERDSPIGSVTSQFWRRNASISSDPEPSENSIWCRGRRDLFLRNRIPLWRTGLCTEQGRQGRRFGLPPGLRHQRSRRQLQALRFRRPGLGGGPQGRHSDARAGPQRPAWELDKRLGAKGFPLLPRFGSRSPPLPLRPC